MQELNVLKLQKIIPAKVVESQIDSFIDNSTTHIVLHDTTYKRLLGLVQKEEQMFHWYKGNKIPYITNKEYRVLMQNQTKELPPLPEIIDVHKISERIKLLEQQLKERQSTIKFQADIIKNRNTEIVTLNKKTKSLK